MGDLACTSTDNSIVGIKIPLDYLTEEDKNYIASHMDAGAAWKHTAGTLGMETHKIEWIPYRISAKGSETLIFLDDLKRSSVSLNEFIEAVNNSQYKVMPVIDFLKRRYPEIEEKFIRETKTPSIRIQSQPSGHSCPGQNHSSHGQNHSSHGENLFGSLRKTCVLLIHGSSDLKEGYNMARWLKKNNVKAIISNEDGLVSTSLRDFLIHKADYVVVVVSPGFQGNVNNSVSNASYGRVLALLKSMVAEKQRKDRFIVALIDGAKPKDAPNWMRCLKMYKWPDEYKNLLCFIIDFEHAISISRIRFSSGGNSSLPLRSQPCSSNRSPHHHGNFQCSCSSMCPLHGTTSF